MVETALFTTALLALVVGVFQVAIAVNAYLRVINAAREGGRYAMRTFDFTTTTTRDNSAQATADQTETAATPLDLSADTTVIVTAVQTTTTSLTPSITSYTPYYCYDTAVCSTSVGAQGSNFTSGEVLTRFSQGNQTDGDDSFVIVEFFYRYPLFVWNANVPMYSYSIFRVLGQ